MAKRVQFSISLLEDDKRKLDILADMRGLKTTQLIEKIVQKELSAIPLETWAMIDKVREAVKEPASGTAADAALKRNRAREKAK